MSFQVIGKLVNVESEYRGNNFLIVDIELELGSKDRSVPLALQAKGNEGHRVLAMLDGAPEGTLVELHGQVEFREGKTRDGDVRTYSDLTVYHALIRGNVGQLSSAFRMQGFITGLKDIPRRDGGTFQVGELNPVAFSRNEHIPFASIDMHMSEEHLDTWRKNIGNFVFVIGDITGYKSKGRNGGADRVWPRFSVTNLNVAEPPGWMSEYVPEIEEGAAPEQDEPEFEF